jgi:hypothetical protein
LSATVRAGYGCTPTSASSDCDVSRPEILIAGAGGFIGGYLVTAPRKDDVSAYAPLYPDLDAAGRALESRLAS